MSRVVMDDVDVGYTCTTAYCTGFILILRLLQCALDLCLIDSDVLSAADKHDDGV